MNEFIGNHIKFIHDYGQLIMALAMLVNGVVIYSLLKDQRRFIPRSLLRGIGSTIFAIMFIAGLLIFLRITSVQSNVGRILNQLESLKGNKAPELLFKRLENDSVRSTNYYKRKIVLVNYWATWCGPCLMEMPDLNRIQQSYEPKGVVVLAISDETKERLTKFSVKHAFVLQIGYLKSFAWAEMGSERPVTFLINRDGIVVDYFTGPHDFEFFSEKINSVL